MTTTVDVPAGVPEPTDGRRPGARAARSARPSRSGRQRSPVVLDPRLPGYALALTVAIWTLAPNRVVRPRYVWPLEILVVLVLVALVLLGRTTLRWSVAAGGLAVYVALATVSSVVYGTMLTVVTAAGMALMAVATAVLASNLGPRGATAFVDGVIVLAVFEFLVAAGGLFAGTPQPWGYLGGAAPTYDVNNIVPALVDRATGTTGHPIPLGSLFVVAAVFAVFARPGWSWWWRTALVAVFAVGVGLSGSRSSLLALLVGLLFGLVLLVGGRWAAPTRLALVVLIAVALLFGGVRDARVVTSLQGTGSLTHRLGSLGAAGRLFERPPLQALFGSGWDSTASLFRDRYLQLDGFTAVDNQFVTSLAFGGVVGLLVVVAVIAWGLTHVRRDWRPALLAVTVMFFSFDLLTWFETLVLFCAVVAGGSARPDPEPTAVTPAGDTAPSRA